MGLRVARVALKFRLKRLRNDQFVRQGAHAGLGEFFVESSGVPADFSLAPIGISDQSFACVPEVDSGFGFGGFCVEHIKFLQHWILGGGGGLEGVDLGAGGEKNDPAGLRNLVDAKEAVGVVSADSSGEFGIHAKTEISVFELGLEAGSHGGKGEIGDSAGGIGNVGPEGPPGFVEDALPLRGGAGRAFEAKPPLDSA